jgi:hypothetical protein
MAAVDLSVTLPDIEAEALAIVVAVNDPGRGQWVPGEERVEVVP